MLLLPPDAAALVQVAQLVSAKKMRKVSPRSAKVPAGRAVGDKLARRWGRVCGCSSEGTAVGAGSPASDMFGARRLPEAASLAFRSRLAVGGFEITPHCGNVSKKDSLPLFFCLAVSS